MGPPAHKVEDGILVAVVLVLMGMEVALRVFPSPAGRGFLASNRCGKCTIYHDSWDSGMLQIYDYIQFNLCHYLSSTSNMLLLLFSQLLTVSVSLAPTPHLSSHDTTLPHPCLPTELALSSRLVNRNHCIKVNLGGIPTAGQHCLLG